MKAFSGRTRVLGVLAAATALSAGLLAGCAKSSTPQSGGGASSGATSSPSAMAASIGTQKISGVGTVLVNASGRTLYYLSNEKGGKLVCTGSCLGFWPPLLAHGGQAPTAGTGVMGKFATITRTDNSKVQVTYNGFPLYTYSGDSSAGQANGQGIKLSGGVWHAATASGKTASGSGTGSSPSSGGGGYGGGGY